MRSFIRSIGPLLLLTIAPAQTEQQLHAVNGCYAKLSPILEKNGGLMAPELRQAYERWAEDSVLAQLRAAGRFPADEDLAEVDKDETARGALFGAVYPPDPSALQNYCDIRDKLGAPFTERYRSLSLAVAVSRRIKGVEKADGQDFGDNDPTENWADDWVLKTPKGDGTVLVNRIAGFIKDLKIPPDELYNSPERQKQFIDYMKARNEPSKYFGLVKTDVSFGELIKYAMVVAGERPAKRDPKPNQFQWLKQLVTTFDSSPKSTPPGMGWPLFPVKTAPWPLVAPLIHTVPLTETKYIWDAFQGLHGDDRFHTYGPYRDDKAEMPYDVKSSKWFWTAYPDQIQHGSECVQISQGTVDLYSTLCKPAAIAGQPGHSNLISFSHEGETWKADIEQDFAGGAHVTFAQWYFGDTPRRELNFRDLYGWAGAEYHLGLALGMNLSLESYLDARIASNIFQSLPQEVQKTTGKKLLLSAVLTNPFDPDPWYRLFPISDYSERFALARAIRSHNPAGLLPNARCETLDKFLAGPNVGPAGDDLNNYWGNLEEFCLKNFVINGEGPHDEATMLADFNFLKGAPSLGPQELADFAEKFVGGTPPEHLADDTAMDQKLLDQNDPYGRFRMAQRYLAGDGVSTDENKARQLLQDGVSKGEPIAAVLLDRLNPVLSSDGMTITASSTYSPTQDPKHLIDGSGMVGAAHDNNDAAATMWTTTEDPALTTPAPGLPSSPAWVKIDFAHPSWFDAVEIWNLNQPKLTDRGFRRVVVYGTPDGKTWYQLTRTAVLPKASGNPGEFGTVLDNSSSHTALRSVIVAADLDSGNYGGSVFGLSAIRFVVHAVKGSISGGQVTATASSQFSPTQDVNHLINGAGMTGDFHDNDGSAATMWQSAEPATMSTPAPGLLPSPAWVRFDFSRPRAFDEIMIWNFNQANLANRGFRRASIYGTSNGTDWFPLTTPEVIVLPKATGTTNNPPVTIANTQSTRFITSVIIAADFQDGNYKGSCYGLSAVRFINVGR